MFAARAVAAQCVNKGVNKPSRSVQQSQRRPAVTVPHSSLFVFVLTALDEGDIALLKTYVSTPGCYYDMMRAVRSVTL